MATKKITGISGTITINDKDGKLYQFNSAEEAQAWFDSKYGNSNTSMEVRSTTKGGIDIVPDSEYDPNKAYNFSASELTLNRNNLGWSTQQLNNINANKAGREINKLKDILIKYPAYTFLGGIGIASYPISMLLGWGAMEGTDSGIRNMSDGKYKGWGDMTALWLSPYTTMPTDDLAEITTFTHPGAMLGGMAGSPIDARFSPINYTMRGNFRNLWNKDIVEPAIPYVLHALNTWLKPYGKATKSIGTGIHSVRYQGMKDYIGNILDKYFTPVEREYTTYTGDLFMLSRSRVQSMYDELGIAPDDYVTFTVNKDDPHFLHFHKLFGNKAELTQEGYTVTMPARDYLNNIIPFLHDGKAMFRSSDASIRQTNYEQMFLKYPKIVDAHEFSHAIDWVLQHKFKGNGGYLLSQIEGYTPSPTMTGEHTTINLTKDVHKTGTAKGVDYSRIPSDIKTYFKYDTELLARYEQIRNFLGVEDGTPLTLDLWNYAKRYYTSKLIDNNMQLFFKVVTNPEEFIAWANKRPITNVTGDTFATSVTLPEAPKYRGITFSNYMNFDEHGDFYNLVTEQANTDGLDLDFSNIDFMKIYSGKKPKYLPKPKEWIQNINGKRCTLFAKNNPNVGDAAYSSAHMTKDHPFLRKWYIDIINGNGNWNIDTVERARAFLWDVKARIAEDMAQDLGHYPNAEEFSEGLYDYTIPQIKQFLKTAHGGHYNSYDSPLKVKIDDMQMEHIEKILEALKHYKDGGTLIPKFTSRTNK